MPFHFFFVLLPKISKVMKTLNTSFVRIVIAVIASVLLFMFSDNVARWLTQIIGALFALSGVISLCTLAIIGYRRSDTDVEKPRSASRISLSVVGLGSVLFGVVLIFLTSSFVGYVPRILASLLIVCALGEVFRLVSMLRRSPLNWKCWILPVLSFCVSCITVYDPKAILVNPYQLLAVLLMVYALSEVYLSFSIHRALRATQLPESLVPAIEEDSDDVETIAE